MPSSTRFTYELSLYIPYVTAITNILSESHVLLCVYPASRCAVHNASSGQKRQLSVSSRTTVAVSFELMNQLSDSENLAYQDKTKIKQLCTAFRNMPSCPASFLFFFLAFTTSSVRMILRHQHFIRRPLVTAFVIIPKQILPAS